MAKAKAKSRKAGGKSSGGGYFESSRGLALSFLLIAPLLVGYEAALIWFPSDASSGAGEFIKDIFFTVFQTRAALYFNGAVVLALLAATICLARNGEIRPGLIFPIVLESAAWAALLIGFAILLHRQDVLACYTGSEAARDVLRSVGAGVYEEILFRLIMMSAFYLLALFLFKHSTSWSKLFGERHPVAMGIAIVVSAVIFARCHVGYADPKMAFYIPSGIFFGLLYATRGLGVAVYTHVIYDVIAFWSQAS